MYYHQAHINCGQNKSYLKQYMLENTLYPSTEYVGIIILIHWELSCLKTSSHNTFRIPLPLKSISLIPKKKIFHSSFCVWSEKILREGERKPLCFFPGSSHPSVRQYSWINRVKTFWLTKKEPPPNEACHRFFKRIFLPQALICTPDGKGHFKKHWPQKALGSCPH